MFYKLKRPTDIDWFDLFQLEHPDRAIDIITQLNGPHYQGQATTQLVDGIDQLFPDGNINPNVVDRALRSGEFILVPYTQALSPMLRQVINMNTSDATEIKNSSHLSEWQLSTNTFSEHLTATLHYLIDQTPKPIFAAAAIRQKANPKAAQQQQQKQQPKDIYWIELACEYKTDSKGANSGANNGVDKLPYTVTFSDGSIKKGKLDNGFARLTNIPAGQVTVEFGYPEAEPELKQARKDLQVCLDEIIRAVQERGSMLDEALAKENIGMQGLILTGAFFDGLFSTIGDTAEGVALIASDMAKTARVKLDDWEGIADDVKYETIEYIENKKETYLEFIAEIDEKRGSVEDAINKSTQQLKSDLEELASYADSAVNNAYAYGESGIEELTAIYNHYALLFEDNEIGKMLKDFPGRYYDAMPKVEAAQAGGGAGFNLLTAILTGGAGAGVAIAGLVLSKANLFRKAKKIIDKVLNLLEKKKSTPPQKISKQHNEVAEVKVEKPKKEEVKEKDKKKCKICKKDYNPRCPNANKSIKPAYDLAEDEADENLEGTGGRLTKSIVSNKKNPYKKIEDHPWYFQRKQGSRNYRSIQAHHIIVTETMNIRPIKSMCKEMGYNINHYSNGVMLPGYLDLACHLAVPLHKSSHTVTDTDQKESVDNAEFLNYPDAVGFKVKEILIDYKSGRLCSNNQDSRAIFINKMKKISQKIFIKVKAFKWTLTATGKLFKENKLGCCNETEIPKQKFASSEGIECTHRVQGTSHGFNSKDGELLNIAKNEIGYIKIGY